MDKFKLIRDKVSFLDRSKLEDRIEIARLTAISLGMSYKDRLELYEIRYD